LAKQKSYLVTTTVILMLLSLGTALHSQDVPQLTNIQVNKSQNQLEVRLEISGSANYESFTLFNPNRLVIDLLQVSEFSNTAEIDVNDFGVTRIRTAKNQPDVVRVVFDLEDTVPSYSIEDRQGVIHIFFRAERPAERQPEPTPARKEPERKTAPPVTQPRETSQPMQETAAGSETRGRSLAINLGGGMYMPHSSVFQEVYGKSSLSLGLGFTYTLPLSNVEDLGFSLDGSYIFDTGETTFTGEEVKLTLIPVMLNVIYQRQFGKLMPFAGLGASYFSYKETLPDTFVTPEVTGNVFGYNFLIGTHVKVIPQLSVRAQFRYHVAKKTDDEGFEINLSGGELGIGLSYFFNFK